MSENSKTLNYIKQLWPLLTALVVIAMSYSKVKNEQVHFKEILTVQQRDLNDCKSAIDTIKTDLKWIKAGVDKNTETQDEILRELRNRP